MTRRRVLYLGYAVSVVAGLMIATDALPKGIVLVTFVVGVALILAGDRESKPD